jgi:soluble lytic murein transglycosylase-like protein
VISRENTDLEDHVLAARARQEIHRATTALSAKDAGAAIAHARTAVGHWLEVEERHPLSPWSLSLPRELAHAELLQGRALVLRAGGSGMVKKAKKRVRLASGAEAARARELFTRALVRLERAGALHLLPPETLQDYAALCPSHASDTCELWLQKLARLFPSASRERTVLVDARPELARLPPLPTPNRANARYQAPDFDQLALDAPLGELTRGRCAAALDGLRRFLDEFPRSALRHRARFWLGECLREEGENQQASVVFLKLLEDSPLSYYGLLAATRLGKTPAERIDGALPVAATRDALLSARELRQVERAERFLAGGAPRLAALELRELSPRAVWSTAFLVYLATLHSEAGNHAKSFAAITELLQRGAREAFSTRIVGKIFPAPYLELIEREARASGLDPILVLSLIKQESAFQADASSSVGASGLMQLMHATAVETEPGIARFELIQPEVSVRIGTRYLRRMLDRYQGNIALALGAYNAGPGAMDRWVREGRTQNGLLRFIERIPFRETREYVSAIIRNHHWYSSRLGDQGPRDLEYFWRNR